MISQIFGGTVSSCGSLVALFFCGVFVGTHGVSLKQFISFSLCASHVCTIFSSRYSGWYFLKVLLPWDSNFCNVPNSNHFLFFAARVSTDHNFLICRSKIIHLVAFSPTLSNFLEFSRTYARMSSQQRCIHRCDRPLESKT